MGEAYQGYITGKATEEFLCSSQHKNSRVKLRRCRAMMDLLR
jgi:hypothetical protein